MLIERYLGGHFASYVTSYVAPPGMSISGYTREDGTYSVAYPVVIINWVQYLGPPGPFSFPDSRDLLEVLRRTSLAERESPREDPWY